MKIVKAPLAVTAAETIRPFRRFTMRIILTWMFAVFTYWMITNHLPSQHLFTDETKAKLPAFLRTLTEQQFKSYRMLFELIFSVSLLIVLFMPNKKIWVTIHFISAVLFGVSQVFIKGSIPIPLTAYIILIISFFFKNDLRFRNAFDFLLSIIIVLIILYASNYFVRWYNYFRSPFYNVMIKPKADSYTFRDKLLTTVMPWFYCLFILLGVRIFTTKLNRILLVFCVILLILEFYLNHFFDPGLTFMLIPFINWQNIYRWFNARYRPK